MKKLLIILFLFPLFVGAQSAASRATLILDANRIVYANNQKKIIADSLNWLIRRILLSDYNIATDGGAFLTQGSNSYTANTSIINTGTFGVKSTGTHKMFSATTGSIFSFKFASGDSVYQNFVTSGSNCASSWKAVSSGGSCAMTISARNNKLSSIISSGAINSVTQSLDTSTLTVSSTYASFGGAKYGANYGANFTARSFVDKGYVDSVKTSTTATGTAGGDLSSTYPNPLVSKINGVSLGTTTATAGNLLIGSGAIWTSQAVTGDITITSGGVTTIKNSVSLVTPLLGTPTSGSLGSCTSTTQSANDNSTKLATTAYVDRELGELFHTISTPTTSATVTLTNNYINIINPAGTIAALTVNFPNSPSNNDFVEVTFDQIITSVTYVAGTGGATIKGQINGVVGGQKRWDFDNGTNTWYIIPPDFWDYDNGTNTRY